MTLSLFSSDHSFPQIQLLYYARTPYSSLTQRIHVITNDIAKIINTHNITLLPLNASNHWFLAEINNVTKTIMLHSSAGTCGQRTWVPTLQQWLITMIPGPWRTLQSQSLQQPGTTECGTHLLLNIMHHIPTIITPDTTTILWSKNMRIHL